VTSFKTFLREDTEKLKLELDNPGGSWLKHERSYHITAGKRDSGAPRVFGTVTATWSRHALVPVNVLAKIPGAEGEQKRVRVNDLEGIKAHMKSSKKLPFYGETADSDGRQHCPFIMVDLDGVAWVGEGNHRIMAAAALEWEYLPVEIRYFDGGEGEAGGTLTPADVKKYDSQGLKDGYSPGDDFTGEKYDAAAVT
jgi:hypothetical protein